MWGLYARIKELEKEVKTLKKDLCFVTGKHTWRHTGDTVLYNEKGCQYVLLQRCARCEENRMVAAA